MLKMHRRDFDVGIAHTFKIIVGGKAEHRYMQMRVGAVIAKINAKFAAMKPATTLRISPGIQRGTYRLEHRHTTLKRKKLARK